MRFRARTTVPGGQWREYPNAEAVLAHTRIRADVTTLEHLPPPELFSWAEFMGEHGRCWRVERIA